MTISFYINHLNHHQAPVADELFLRLGSSFHFIETCEPTEGSNKGSKEDYSNRKYLIQAWRNQADKEIAVRLTIESDVALFGAGALEYQLHRARNTDGVSFELSERWLKRGLLSLLSPRLWRSQWYYHTLFFRKPVYKLCASGFAASDQYMLHSFEGRCYKWGYFPLISLSKSNTFNSDSSPDRIRMMWCSRFIKLKHPELPVLLAERLKNRGYSFVINMFGDGDELIRTEELIREKDLSDCVVLNGSKPHEIILDEMRNHSIFLFTSDRREGWGAVANESMASGCLLVSSSDIGSTPYLVKHRVTGCIFKSRDLLSLETEIVWILENPEHAKHIREAGKRYINEYWSPQNAAISLLSLSESLMLNQSCPISEGPCSIA